MSYHVIMTKERVVRALEALSKSGIEYDGFIGTGTSGALVAPVLAYETGKPVVLVRKADDKSNHDYSRLVGDIGDIAFIERKLIFADDFIASGNTLRFVANQLRKQTTVSRLVATFEANTSKVTDISAWGNLYI